MPAVSQILSCGYFSTKRYYQHSLAMPHQALPALQQLLPAIPWKVLAHFRGWGL